jgi:NADPH:quinone reductase-like Zn-dependent oxidoreductase
MFPPLIFVLSLEGGVTLKAWVVNEEHSLRFENIPVRNLSENEILVKIKASGINNRDKSIRYGRYSRSFEPPIILGGDIAGVVQEVGVNVKGVKPTDKVLLFPILGCGKCRYCKMDELNYCKDYQSLIGGMAEYKIVPVSCAVKIPEYFSYEEAAALPIAYLTAWNMMFKKASLKPKETVLIWGASGGVGIAGIQFAMPYTNNIIAISRNQSKRKKLLDLGVPYVIDSLNEDIFETVMEITNGEGVDIIFDPIGGNAWEKNMLLLKNGGRHVNCGRSSGGEAKINIQQLFQKQISILGAKTGTKKDLQYIMEFLERFNFKPIIDKTYPFSEANKAMKYFEEGNHFGKVIIKN